MLQDSLSQRDAFILITIFALIAHLAFKKYEPTNSHVLLVLLLIVPGILSSTLLSHFRWFYAVPIAFWTYFLVLFSSIIAYRISPFHPLAKYPGPVGNKVSKLWMAWIGTSGKQHIHYENLHRMYGDVVRIGPNELSIRDPAAIAPLLGPQGLPKGPQQEGRLMKTSIPSLVSIRDRDLHARRRAHWLRGLNSTSVKDYEPLIAKRVQQLVDLLVWNQGTEVDLSQTLSYFAYDFMGDMAFGGGTEMMRDGDVNGLWKLQDKALNVALFFGHIPWIAPFAYRFSLLTGNLIKFRRFGMAAAEKRKREGSATKDLFYHLIDEGGVNKEPPTLAQVVSDGSLAIIAGSDTTATVLSNLFYFLMANREAYKCLQAEVDKFYPEEEDPFATRHHEEMVYLSACINESMRILPPVPEGSQRASYAGMGPTAIGPYVIPESTSVSTHFWAIQRDPKNFSPGADVFWPERWLIAQGIIQPTPHDFVHNASAFAPFSYGPANCVGKGLAMQEMRTVVCALMQRCEMRFADGYDARRWEADMEDFQILKRGRLPVVVSVR